MEAALRWKGSARGEREGKVLESEEERNLDFVDRRTQDISADQFSEIQEITIPVTEWDFGGVWRPNAIFSLK